MGNTEIEDALQELDKLTQEEARMASVEVLRIVHNVDGNVMGVNDKLEQVNRSSSPNFLFSFWDIQILLQETSSGITFFDGFRLQIHLPIITLHQKSVMTVQLSGFFGVVSSTSGNPLVPYCGFMANVSTSRPLSVTHCLII
jgi:hypothetical protein